MPTLTLVRDHPADIAHRYAIMSLDGELVGRMKFKDSVTVEVQPGAHVLEGKNELGGASSLDLDVGDEDLTVHIGGIATGCFAALMWFVPPAPTIVMKLGDSWD